MANTFAVLWDEYYFDYETTLQKYTESPVIQKNGRATWLCQMSFHAYSRYERMSRGQNLKENGQSTLEIYQALSLY